MIDNHQLLQKYTYKPVFAGEDNPPEGMMRFEQTDRVGWIQARNEALLTMSLQYAGWLNTEPQHLYAIEYTYVLRHDNVSVCAEGDSLDCGFEEEDS